MLTPEKMSLVHIICLEESLIEVMEVIANSEIAHFIDTNGLPEENGLGKINLSDQKAKLTSCITRLERILDSFPTKLKLSLDKPITISPEDVANRADKFISELEYETSSIITQIELVDNDIEEFNSLSWKLSPLEDINANIEQIRDTQFLYVEIGTIHEDAYDKFTQAIEQIPRFMSKGTLMGGVYPIIVGAPVQYKNRLVSALEAANFSKSDIPEDIMGDIDSILQELELEIWKRREEKVDLQMQLQAIKQQRQDMLEWVYTNLKANQTVTEAMENIIETNNTYLIPCYVPSNRVHKLEEDIEKRFKSGVLFKSSGDIEAFEAKEDKSVPTKLEHPSFLRPFEVIVNNFGYPSYFDLDPTLFAAFGFLLMFGIMFADLGHGAVLFILGLVLGWYPAEALKPVRQIAKLITACGVSSMLFGVIFGHAFGLPLIDALWFVPELHEPESINKLLIFGIFVGVFMLSLGVSLNIFKAFRAKDLHEAIAGKWGLCSLLFYWTTLFLLVYSSHVKKIISNVWILALLLFAILLPVLIWSPVSYLLHKQDEQHGEGIGAEIVESGFHVFELVMGYLANTMSYIRVAAFNLSHAGLMLAVYALNEQFEMEIWASLPSIILENIFVIALEGLIVSVQCLRLEYYEFFSKFFSGSGIEYKPLKVR